MQEHIEILAADPASPSSVTVRLARVDAYDAPVAFRVRDTEGAMGRVDVVEVRAHGDALWRRYGQRYGHPALSGDAAIAEASSDPYRHDNPFGTGPDVPVSERAAQLLVVEGELWERVPEPVAVLVHDSDGDVPHLAFRWEGPTDPSDTFRIDELELAASCSPHPVDVPFVQVLMPECIRHDAYGTLLSRAAREVVEGLRDVDVGYVAPAWLDAAASGGHVPGTLDALSEAAAPLAGTVAYPPSLAAARARALPPPAEEWDGPEPAGLTPH